jgi:hypothetical protein
MGELRRHHEDLSKMTPRLEPTSLGNQVEGVTGEVAAEATDANGAVGTARHRARYAPVTRTADRQPRGLALAIAWIDAKLEGGAEGFWIAKMPTELPSYRAGIHALPLRRRPIARAPASAVRRLM